nr:amino acid ABC transporter permease [uncultured Dongia sp.]
MDDNFDLGAIAGYSGLFLQGAGTTLGLIAIAASLSFLISIGGAATVRWGAKWARRLVMAYVELIRNTPFIVQMFFIFFGLPSLGLKLTAITAAIIAVTVNLTAYCIEILRAGIEAVPPGQREAGLALGLPPIWVFFSVILPQAIANVYPALVSQIILTMLESAVVSKIAVMDLTHVADLIQSRNYRTFEAYFVVAMIYLVMAICLRRLMARVGQRLFAGRVR